MYTDKLEIKYLFWTWRQKYSEGRGQGGLRPGNEEKKRKEMAQIVNSEFVEAGKHSSNIPFLVFLLGMMTYILFFDFSFYSIAIMQSTFEMTSLYLVEYLE